MNLKLVAILALVVFLLVAIFAIVTQRRAMATCQSDNEEMSKKLQEISFKLREAERIKEEGEDEVESKVKEQEQTIEEQKTNFEAALNRKNEHLGQLTSQLRQMENANQMLVGEVQRLQAQVQQMAQALGQTTSKPSAPQTTTHGKGQPPAPETQTPQGQSQSPEQGASCDLSTGQCTLPSDGQATNSPGPAGEPEAETVGAPEAITSPPTFAASMFSSNPAPETLLAEHSPST